MVVLNAVQSVLSIVIIISVAYVLTGKGWFDNSTAKLFSKLVINISLPAMMLYNMLTSFDIDTFISAGNGLIIPVLSMLISFLISVLLVKIIKLNPKRIGLFQTMFFASNTIFMGMPINISLFGEESIPFVLLYYIANTTLFWTLGVSRIKRDGDIEQEKRDTTKKITKIFTPPLMGFTTALILIALDISLPKFAMESCKYIGNLTTPLSLFFIGITFHSLDIKNIRFSFDMVLLFIGRFVIAPTIVYIITLFLPIPSLMTKVFIIQSAMPIVTQAAIVSKSYKADYEYAAVMVATTTVASLIFIPLFMIILQ